MVRGLPACAKAPVWQAGITQMNSAIADCSHGLWPAFGLIHRRNGLLPKLGLVFRV